MIVVERDMHLVAASDWAIDIGPGAGDEGGRVVASGTPAEVMKHRTSRTASHLAAIRERQETEGDCLTASRLLQARF